MLKIQEKIIFGHDPKLFIWNGREMEGSCTNSKQSEENEACFFICADFLARERLRYWETDSDII